MSRENKEVKGRRLLTEGRLQAVEVTQDAAVRAPIIATCRGDSGRVYNLGYDTKTHTWRCDCDAKSHCSHLVALQLVTAIPKGA